MTGARHRTLTWVGLLCIYTGIAIWSLRPVSYHPGEQVPGVRQFTPPLMATLADVYLTLWILSTGVQQLATDPSQLFHPQVFYPERYALAFSTHMLGHQPLFAPTYLATGNPVLALNVSLMTSAALLGIGTHLLIRHWGGGTTVAILGASLALAAPWRVGSATVRVHTLWVHYLPFILLFFDRYVERRHRRDLAIGGLCLLLQILTSYYVGYAAFIMLGIYLLARLRAHPSATMRAGACIAGVALVAAVVSYPYVFIERSGTLRDPSAIFGALLPLGAPGVLTATVVGVLPVLGAALLLLPRRWLPARTERAPIGILCAVAVAGYLLAPGPQIQIPRAPSDALRTLWAFFTVWDPIELSKQMATGAPDALQIPLPYALLDTIVPGFDRLRAPYRFGGLPAVVLPIVAAIALGRVATHLPRGRNAALTGLVIAVLAAIPPVTPNRVPTRGELPPAYDWLRAHGGGRPLLELPIRRDQAGIYHEARAMYFASFHSLPLLNGYSGHVPESFRRRARTANRLPDHAALSTLCKDTELAWVLVHLDRLAARLRRRWEEGPSGLHLAARFDNDVIFRARCPQ